MSTKSNKEQTNIAIKNKQKEYNKIGLDNIVSIDDVPFYREMVSLKGWGKEGRNYAPAKPSVKKRSIYSKKHTTLFSTCAKKVNIF